MKISQEKLQYILARPAIKFHEEDYLFGIRELNNLGNTLSLIVYDYEQGENYAECQVVRDYISHVFDYILFKGYEPTFNNSHNWGYPMLCQCFALIKNKESLWNLFDEDAQKRITCLMKMFALMWNFGCNKYNRYRSGIGLHGNFKKGLNPNYMLSNDALILYCVHFFGDIKKVSSIMMNTKYDNLIKELKSFGFKNAYKAWTTEGVNLPDGTKSAGARELYGSLAARRADKNYWVHMYRQDEDGNILYLGKGKGCSLPFYYDERDTKVKDYTSYPDIIYNKILKKCFNGGVCVNSIKIDTEEDFSTYIKDNVPSPYTGQEGMMLEFNHRDWGGTRSSLFHCETDFYLIAAMVTTLKLLGVDVLSDDETYNKVVVGMGDFLHKKEHGYIGYCLGEVEYKIPVFALEQWIDDWKEKYSNLK